MSRVYIHTVKYGKRNRRAIVLALVILIAGAYVISTKVYAQYVKLNQSPQTQISNSGKPLLGYITPYFMFKDTGKWLQDKEDSNANRVVYQQYIHGEVARVLDVNINKVPNMNELAASRILPVHVTGGDSLSPGSISSACGSSLPAGQMAIKEIKMAGSQMWCDPNPRDYSVVFVQPGGDYQLKMVGSKIPENFVIIYRDYTTQPSTGALLNIANSFKAV